ncbi:MAG TPA: GTPase [candidate division Zixibacteria bacterium]|nr:GTPase [candidate division Zixibacteria bacterium]HEQ99470.1 GTPase [candidate division Zixibacteria bacterium]
MTKNVIIMGAAGRDFHNFNTFYRDNKSYKVVAFTATQIPNIEGRKYPAKLAGKLYPRGIPILPEEDLEKLIAKHKVDEVVFSYSDVPQQHVMHAAAVVDRAGASFVLLGSKETMIKSKKPVIAITAIRTGCGKSQTTRRVCAVLKEMGKQPVAIRHPMPYGDLSKQISQRFAKLSDLKKHNCTIEEMEEYEPHIKAGTVCYAGVDYAEILKNAEKEADVIVWDGGNNDTPFYKPDLWIVVTDPHRAGHELTYFPGFTNFISADVIVMNKMETADPEDIEELRENISIFNPLATVIEGVSPVFVDDPEVIRGKSVLVVEDGPTLTHGEMRYGAGIVAAQKFGAIDFVDPRPFLKGTLKSTFEKYPNIGPLLPAMGYGDQQIKDLSATINATECDSVVIATPIDLRRIINIKKPSTRVSYELQEIGAPDMTMVISEFFKKKK